MFEVEFATPVRSTPSTARSNKNGEVIFDTAISPPLTNPAPPEVTVIESM